MFQVGNKDILSYGTVTERFYVLKNQKRHFIIVETIRDVYSYVVENVNYDTVSYLVYNSPKSQKRNRGWNLSVTVL